jgi:hypothetical protein
MHVILQTNRSSFSINAPWPSSSRQRGRCQLDMVNKLLIPGPLSPTATFALALELDALREREPMFKTLIQEAVALASLALFIAMIAIWTQVLGNL